MSLFSGYTYQSVVALKLLVRRDYHGEECCTGLIGSEMFPGFWGTLTHRGACAILDPSLIMIEGRQNNEFKIQLH